MEMYGSAKADESSFSKARTGQQQQILACLAAICGFLLLSSMGGCAGTASSSTSPSSQQAPQISASQTGVNVLTGGTANVTLTVSGTPTPSVGCAVSGAGTAQLSGLVMTYTAPNIVPAGGEATIACTASNAAGSATALVTANILAVIPGHSGPVPSTFFGNTIMDSRDWPSIPFGTLGKQPGVQWPYVEQTRGNFNWTRLDPYVAEANAHGVSLVYTSSYVPPWAAADQSSCRPYAYQTTVCTSTVANIADWQNFVTALVTRYKGRIQVYELWNEPSCLCTFTGTVAQLVALTQAEHDIIRSIDPAALIIGPTMQGYESAYLDSYFAAGGTTDIDAVGMHSSPNPNNDFAEFMMGSVTTGIKSVMEKYGLSSKQLWNTENDWGSDAFLTNPDAQAAFVARDLLLNWNVGVTRDYWYAWDNSGVGTLWSPQTGVVKAGIAYEQVESWMKGATIAPCSLNGSTNVYQALYTCDLTLSTGNQAQAVWNTGGSLPYTAPSQFTQYRDLSGNTYSVPLNQQVTIGLKPILLEAPAP
jgi:polysaccharide biosynthesis protein PslG